MSRRCPPVVLNGPSTHAAATAGASARSAALQSPRTTPPAHADAAPSLQVNVSYALPRTGLPGSASFRCWVEAALRGAGHRRRTELSIRIVGSDEGLALNHDYRGRDYPTNVLSFAAEPPPGVRFALIGDLAICAPVVEREAVEQGKSARDHWAHLTIHGVLHLLGHDHLHSGEAEIMETLEARVLARLGIANPYA